MRYRLLPSLVVSFFVTARNADAQTQANVPQCFTLAQPTTSSLPIVKAGDQLRLDGSCAYSLHGGRLMRVDASHTWDYAALAAELSRHPLTPGASPHAISACAPGQCGVEPDQRGSESVQLEACTQTALQVAMINATYDAPRLTVQSSDRTKLWECFANTRLVFTQSPQPRSLWCVGNQCSGSSHLSSTDTTASLARGVYDVFAVRQGATSGWLVGRVSLGVGTTPGQRWILDEQRDRLTRTWDGGPLRFNVDLQANLADELRVAAASQQLVIRGPDARQRPLLLSDGDESLMLPDEIVRDAMTRRYGQAGRSVAPTRDEWTHLLAETDVCLVRSYSQTLALPLAHPNCRSLAAVSDEAPGASPSPNFWLQPREVDLHEDAARRVASSRIVLDPERVHIAQVGETLHTSSTDPLYLCDDQSPSSCVLLQGFAEFRHSGFYYVVRGSAAAAASSQQAMSLARLAVINPRDDWRPVGLASQHNTTALWAALPQEHDGSVMVRRREDALRTELRTSPAAAWVLLGSPEARGRQLTLDVPTFPAARNEQLREASAPTQAALVQIVSSDSSCPVQTARELSASNALQVEQLSPERSFYLVLAEHRGLDAPLRCLAFQRMRVGPQRSLLAGRRVRFGLLGDAILRTTVVLPDAFAAPVLAQSIAYIRACAYCAGRWYIGGDLSIDATIGAHFSRGGLGQLGFTSSLSLAMGYGALPRLVSLGLSLNLVALSSQTHSPFALQLGINLSEIIELVRAR